MWSWNLKESEILERGNHTVYSLQNVYDTMFINITCSYSTVLQYQVYISPSQK